MRHPIYIAISALAILGGASSAARANCDTAAEKTSAHCKEQQACYSKCVAREEERSKNMTAWSKEHEHSLQLRGVCFNRCE